MRATGILQVEDDETDVLLLQHAFKKADINEPVHVVNDGREAIDYLSGKGRFADRNTYPLPRMVLLDLKLPETSGLEVLAWMRNKAMLKTTVVIALTSSNQDTDIRRAYELGANSYVVKPAGLEKRLEVVGHLKGWWLRCNQFAEPIV